MGMRGTAVVVAGMVAGAACGWASEPPRGCFRSISEAAAQTRALDPANVGPGGPEAAGFRLEDLRRDRLLNKRWAIVRSCDHPERPAITVEMGADGQANAGVNPPQRPVQAVAYTAPLVRAGARVRLVGGDSTVQMEMTGIAQSNGALGQSIQVRLVSATNDNEAAAPVLTGTVRGADVLEWER